MAKKRKKGKPKRPKGRPLSETLAAKSSGAPESEPESQPGEDEEEGRHSPSVGSEAIRRATSDDSEDDEGDEDDEDEDEDEDEDDDRQSIPDSAPSSVSDEDDEDDEDEDDEDDDEEPAAAQMGHTRYVMAGFFAAWLVIGYVAGRVLELVWSTLAAKDWFSLKLPQLAAVPHEGELISRESISLVLGGVIAAILAIRYYYRPDIRTWADEVAEEISQVKWPTRKEVGNNTVVVIAASTVLTIYLTLLDRLWGFVSNLIYSAGT